MPTSPPSWLDTQEFEEVLETAFRHLRTEFSPPSAGARRVRETIEPCREEFLALFSLSHAPDFDERWDVQKRGGMALESTNLPSFRLFETTNEPGDARRPARVRIRTP
jgi:hypothetical protein